MWFHSKGQPASYSSAGKRKRTCVGTPNNEQNSSVKPRGQPGIWLNYWSGKTYKYIEIVFMVEIKVPEETAFPHSGHGAEL